MERICRLQFNVPVLKSRSLTNVALFKPTTQSGGGDGSKAVDNSTSQHHNLGHCMSTGNHNNPYWEVDLEAPYAINNVRIFRRHHCCSNHLSNLRLEASLDHTTYTEFYYHSGTPTMSQVFWPTSNISGRWIRITSLNDNFDMIMCEVQVWSNGLVKADWAQMLLVESSIGTGSILNTTSVYAISQCSYSCLIHKMCAAVNVILSSDSQQMECQLLSSGTYTASVHTNITFWKMTFE